MTLSANPEPTEPSVTIGDPKAIPDYSIHILEVLGIGLGATLIVAFALWEAANKFLSNLENPKQAEEIFEQVVNYDTPNNIQGLKSLKTNRESFALVSTRNSPPNTLIFVSRASIKKTANVSKNLIKELDIPSAIIGTWQDSSQTVVDKSFCGKIQPITIRAGTYRLIEQPHKVIPMYEYTIERPQKQVIDTIQVFGIGPKGQQQVEMAFAALKCPQGQ